MTFRTFLTNILICLTFLACKKEDLLWNLKAGPELTNLVLADNNLNDLSLTGNCSSDGYDKNTEKGICWSIKPNPTIIDNIITSEKGKGIFTKLISWGIYSKIYARAYAKNSIATVYSNELEVNWPGSSANKPIITSISASNITFSGVTAIGKLISDGGLAIANKGFIISQNSMPTLANAIGVVNSNSSINTYTVDFQNLTNNTTYYLCAFATNIAGTSYGNILTINTKKYYTVGQTGPAGGFIFYSKQDTIGGWNFLEAAPYDYSAIVNWNAANISVTNSNATAIGNGLLNTNLIYSQFGNNNYAAAICYNYNLMGYNDWFLPSRDELIKMYDNLFMFGTGNFNSNYIYWSSSEDAIFSQNAWTVKMNTGMNNNFLSYPKSTNFYIRPIRRF